MLDRVGDDSFFDLAELECFEGDQKSLDGVLDDTEVSIGKMFAHLRNSLEGSCLTA